MASAKKLPKKKSGTCTFTSDLAAVVDYAWADEMRNFEERYGDESPVPHPDVSEEEFDAAFAAYHSNPGEETTIALACVSTGHVFCCLARLAAMRPQTCVVGRLDSEDNGFYIVDGHLDSAKAVKELNKLIKTAYTKEERAGKDVYLEGIVHGYNMRNA